jgi:xylitol oxidase
VDGLGTNWAGNYRYRAARLHRPASVHQLQEIVAAAKHVRVLGSRHSFTDIADSCELVTLEGLPTEVNVDHQHRTVSVTAAVTYAELARELAREGVALANLASLPHISVAGAVSTASHGSGDRNGNLATSVCALELVRADGSPMRVAREDPEFDGLVVGLGALGALTRITLDVESAYDVHQRVFEDLSWRSLLAHFDEIMSSGYSVSVFTRWGAALDQVWVKSRTDPSSGSLFGAATATAERHPIIGLDPANATAQLGVPGPWSERLPHFRRGFIPSSGAEIQSEYLVPRRHAVPAIEAVRALGGTIGPLVQVSEIRTVAADELWMSPQYHRDTVGIHFTWVRDQPAVERALVDVEAALARFEARPHWGKLFLAPAGAMYERQADFAALVQAYDPEGTFSNDWLRTRVLGCD